MEMDTGEIRRQYKYAKDRKKCISILADLNCCSKDDIKAILGLNEKNSGNIEEINSLYARLDELDAAIRPLEDEYRRTVKMIQSAESG